MVAAMLQSTESKHIRIRIRMRGFHVDDKKEVYPELAPTVLSLSI